MKKRDAILIGVVLVLTFAVWGGMTLWQSQTGTRLKITVDGETYGFYRLDEDQQIAVGSTNVCRIYNGQVTMAEASCPDHLCMKQKAISVEESGTIVCLPNRVVLEITGEPAGQDVDVTAVKTGGKHDFIYQRNCCRD